MALKEYAGEIVPIGGAPSEMKPYDGEIVPIGQEKAKPSPLRRVADIPVALAKGVVGAGEAAVGLADLATGGQAGKALHDATGYDPKATKAFLDEQYSPQQKAAKAEVDQATGFTGKAKAMLENPSTIGEAVVESAPLMLGGGAVAQGLGKATKLGAVARSALGEGIVGAGSAAEGIRQETPEGTLDGKQSLAALGTGAGTAAITAASGGIARKLGISDLDTQLATRGGVAEGLANTSTKGRARRLGEGALTEGVLEEMPQSGLEQGLQNVALDKPIGEGVPEAMAAGMLTGAAMGGPLAAAPATAKVKQQPEQPPATENQPAATATAPAPAPILDAQAMERAGVMPPPVLDDEQIRKRVDLESGAPIPFTPTPAEELAAQRKAAMGIDPAAGPLSAGAAIAVETQAAEEVRLGAAAMLAEGAARAQQAQAERAAWEAANPGIPYEPVTAAPASNKPAPSAAPSPSGSFGAMNDFAELLSQERQNVAQRRAGIAERQGQRRDFDLAEADRRTAESMQREAQARRRVVLDSVLADPETKNPAGRFAAMLRRDGYRDSAPTEDELRTIQRFEDVRAAQPAPPEVEPSAPNELDPAALGIRERRAPAAKEAPTPPRNLREGMARVQAARAAEGGSMPAASQPSAAPSVDPGKAWASLSTQQRADLAGRLQGVPPIVSKNVPRAEWGKINPALRAKLAEAMALRAAAPIEGADLGDGWAAFRPESGTAGVPRAEMPQIKAEHRGAMVNFMNARGVAHQEETLPASSLKPTQAEFSREKVARAAGFEGGDRAILVSSDNHILDGHHQWMAAREKGEDVRAIRLNAPIRDLIGLAHDFPSSTKAGGASGPAESTGTRSRAATAADDLRAMSRDAGWSERGGQLIRDAAGNATGRTKWLPRAEWFMAGMEPDPETLARDIDRFAAGEKVPAKSRRTIEGMLDWLDAQRSEPRLDEDASAYDFEAAGLDLDASEETLLIGDIFAEAALQDEAAVMRALGFTEEEIQDVVGQKASREGPRGAGQDGAGRAQEAGEVARSNAQPQGEAGSEGSPEGLTSYTNEDIARREAEAKAREEAKAAADKAADQKAQADAERDTFTLTGSDRPADVLATQGQGGLFDAPAPATQNPIKNENRAKAGPTAETSPPDQSPIKNSEPASPSVGNAPSPLEALFSDLNSDSARKANKARKAAAKLPEAARIEYVQANFHDLLIQLMDAGKLEVNGATTLTEDNASCL